MHRGGGRGGPQAVAGLLSRREPAPSRPSRPPWGLRGAATSRGEAHVLRLVPVDAASCHSELSGGRPSTLGSATAGQEQEENEALEADAGELVTEEEGTYLAYLAFLFGHFEWIWGNNGGAPDRRDFFHLATAGSISLYEALSLEDRG